MRESLRADTPKLGVNEHGSWPPYNAPRTMPATNSVTQHHSRKQYFQWMVPAKASNDQAINGAPSSMPLTTPQRSESCLRNAGTSFEERRPETVTWQPKVGNEDLPVFHATLAEGQMRVTSRHPDHNPPRRVTLTSGLTAITRRAATRARLPTPTQPPFFRPQNLTPYLFHLNTTAFRLPTKRNGKSEAE
jgi:hypothetical protein